MYNPALIPADVVWTIFGLRPVTWLILIAVVIVIAVTRSILKKMKKQQPEADSLTEQSDEALNEEALKDEAPEEQLKEDKS